MSTEVQELLNRALQLAPADKARIANELLSSLDQPDEANGDADRYAWLRRSATQLNAAYDEQSDDYPLDSIKEMNPDYEGR
jgi:hypothetical protein